MGILCIFFACLAFMCMVFTSIRQRRIFYREEENINLQDTESDTNDYWIESDGQYVINDSLSGSSNSAELCIASNSSSVSSKKKFDKESHPLKQTIWSRIQRILIREHPSKSEIEAFAIFEPFNLEKSICF